jgi:hypothetical protein
MMLSTEPIAYAFAKGSHSLDFSGTSTPYRFRWQTYKFFLGRINVIQASVRIRESVSDSEPGCSYIDRILFVASQRTCIAGWSMASCGS